MKKTFASAWNRSASLVSSLISTRGLSAGLRNHHGKALGVLAVAALLVPAACIQADTTSFSCAQQLIQKCNIDMRLCSDIQKSAYVSNCNKTGSITDSGSSSSSSGSSGSSSGSASNPVPASSTVVKPVAGAFAASCHTFTQPIYHNQDQYYAATMSWINFYKAWNDEAGIVPSIGRYNVDVPALQGDLEKEGFSISSGEIAAASIGTSTASAIAGFQEKYSAQILAPQGLAHGFGYVDALTMNQLNQLYGCVATSKIDLLSPNTDASHALGDTVLIKWNATKIPNTTTLNIQYANADGSGVNLIASSTVANGAGSYSWTIPSTLPAGSYKILLSLVGSASSDVSAVPFEIRNSSLQITAPAGGESYAVGQRVNLSWVTSSSIPPSSPVSLSLVSSQSGATSTSVIASSVRNSGSYAWTVPDVFTGAISGTSPMFVMQIVTGGVTSVSAPFSVVPATIVRNVNYASPTCPYTFSTSLAVGSMDSKDIVALQNMLKARGYFVGDSNGIFATTTKTALAAYQSASSLTADGYFGPGTIASVNAACNSTAAVTPTITIGNLAGAVTRGGPMSVTWVPDAAIPARSTVSIVLAGGARNVTLKPAVPAAAGISQVVIPASTVPGSYSITLVPAGVVLGSASVLTANGITVNALSGSITPAISVASAYKSDVLHVTWTGTNVLPASSVSISLVPASGSQTILSTIAAQYKAGAASLTIPSSIADGQYEVLASTVVDGQQVTGTTAAINVSTRPVTTPHVVLLTPADGALLVRGTSTLVTWSAANLPAGAKLNIILADSQNRTVATLGTGVNASLLADSVIIPGTIVPGDHWVKLVPVGVKLDSASILARVVSVVYPAK